MHSHPSGYVNLGDQRAIFVQTPSKQDIKCAGQSVCYLAAMGEKSVYVYNGTGVYGKMSIYNFKSSWNHKNIQKAQIEIYKTIDGVVSFLRSFLH